MTVRNDERLDALVTTLAEARPVLDDLARARIGLRIDAARGARPPAVRAWRWRPWAIGAGAVAAAIAVATVMVAVRGDGGGGTAPAAAIELADGATLFAASSTSVHGELDGSALTLYGPGWARRHDRRIVVDAEAVVVDRPRGEAALEIEYRAASIRVIHATFSVDGVRSPRVHVLRGEVELRCGGAARTVAAGESATCDPAITAAVTPPSATSQPANAEHPAPTERIAATERTTARVSAVALNEHTAQANAVAPIEHAPPTEPIAPTEQMTPNERTPTASASQQAAATEQMTPNERAEQVARAEQTSPSPVDHAAPTIATPPLDLAARYAIAERLMHTDRAAARAALEALVAEHPAAAEAAPAFLDLARLALADGDPAGARQALDRLARHSDAAALAMPAAYLRCLVGEPSSTRGCLARFRHDFPGSIHDADVLARLATATAAAGDCAAALPLFDDYRRRYPAGAHAAAVRAWRDRCAPRR